MQLAEEGAIQLLKPFDTYSEVVIAAVGQLQFEVMQFRLKDEYNVETLISPLPYKCSAWLIGDVQTFQKTSQCMLAKDRHERPIVLFSEGWEKQYAMKQNPNHQFIDILT